MRFFARLAFVASAAVAANAFTGRATFYTPGLNACGSVSSPDDLIAAVSSSYFDANKDTICGTPITVTYQGNSVNVVIMDSCPACTGVHDLDLSPAAFEVLAPLSVGLLNPVTWS
ncbi:RlpA-like double-psi beta-barrel-protein domain-containing protein-containing protein [Collybia nuda]|uniref:RlpA-like double-psi beta-barrel-protein domain-containing protein-containing protein n=1 Tax=Collybia nuda TaxID=64659 RepID=A0A9P5Y0A0_9AGAR|nr:RlpA-like double-psi beta-barrel-protein domain-containing protein-containing protein [Collybia nuda]